MSQSVRNVFALAGLFALYGIALWVYESKAIETWATSFANDPKAIFSREHDRDRMIAEELNAASFITPAEVSAGGDDASIG